MGVSDPTLAFGLEGISYWSTENPFLDIMKTSRPWIGYPALSESMMTSDQLASGGYLDADGWPTQIPPGMESIGNIWAWDATDKAAAASRAGIYVLTYEGEGTLELPGMQILSSAPGRIVVQNLNGGTMAVNIAATDPNHNGNYIHNISLVPQKYEALYQAGEIFNPDWLKIVQDARELRFMDWMGTNGVSHATWDTRPEVGDASWMTKGVPVEVMVQLANQTGTEPWFNMPAGADEDYIRNFATYVRDHLNPDLKVHVEYSNETWNWMFAQTQWLGAQSQAAWGLADGSAWLDYAAMLATKSALIWDDVFGATADDRVDNVMATQTVVPWISEHLLTAPIWQAHDPSGYVAPSSVFDSLAVTTYFGGGQIVDAALRTELLAHIKASPAEAAVWLKDQILDPNALFSIPQIAAYWAGQKAVADKYGLDLVAYEGGQSVLQSAGIGGMSEADLATLTTFLSDFVRSQTMADLYQAVWEAWAAVSDGPFMQFVDVSAASKYGAWGLFTALGDHSPRADLLADLNAHFASWFGSGGGDQYLQGVIKMAGPAGETLTGTVKDDFLIGGRGHDILIGGAGEDTILTGAGNDSVRGGSGHDSVTGGMGSDTVNGGAGNDTLAGGGGDDTIIANLGDDSVHGGYGNDLLDGGLGSDILYGDAGNDTLTGGRGTDVMTGGGGADTFVFTAGDSRAAAPDQITDFHHGEQDVILFSDAHSFMGTAAFSGTAGEIRYQVSSTTGEVHVLFDADGNKHADAEIILFGVNTLVAADFGL